MRHFNKENLKAALSYVAMHPYVITPIAQMVSVQLVEKFGSSGASQADVEALQAQIAKVLGFVAFGDAFTGITGGLAANSHPENLEHQIEINTVQTIASLIFASISIVLDAVMFAPGAKMEKFGSWIIAATFTAATLLKEFAFKNTSARAGEPENNNSLITQFSQFAGSKFGSTLMIALPLVASNFVMQNSASLKNHESSINSTIWLCAIMLNAIPSVIVGMRNLTLAVANAMRLTLLTGVGASLLMMMNLIGSVDEKFKNFAPSLGMGLGVISMLSANATHNLVNKRDVASRIANGVFSFADAFFKKIYFLAHAALIMGPQIIVAAHALTTEGAESTLARNAAQCLTALGMLQNLWAAGAVYRHTHKGVDVEAVLSAVQIVLFGLAMSDRAGDVNGRDIRPTLLILSALLHYIAHGVTSVISAMARTQNDPAETGLLNSGGERLSVANNDQSTFGSVRGIVLATIQNPYGQGAYTTATPGNNV